jgi:flavin-dependent dehydrogenase
MTVLDLGPTRPDASPADREAFESSERYGDPLDAKSLDCDVVVVGARAAGASTALLLARAGLDVILIDRSRYGVDTVSTHALLRGAVVQLRRWGILDRLVAAGTPPIRRATFHYAAGSTTIDFRPGDALYAPRRTVLDPLLVDVASAAGARVHYGITAVDVRRDAAGRVCGLHAQDRRGDALAIRSRLVVGADGYHSAIARLVNAPVERTADGVGAYLYRYWSGVATDGYESIFRSPATAGIIPTNDHLACVFVGCAPERLASGEGDLYATLLHEANPTVAERVLAGSPAGRTRRFTGRPGRMLRPHGPGWALVGDAGYWKDPISAHGLTDALRDAELLARATLSAFDGGTLDETLIGYHDERNRLSGELNDDTDRIARGDWTDGEIEGLVRSLSQSMAAEVAVLEHLDPWPPHPAVEHATPSLAKTA